MVKIGERALDELFAARLAADPAFLAWLLGQTKFAGVACARVDVPWQFQWYESRKTKVQSETDIYLLFACAGTDRRFALHIENKRTAAFRKGQAELYRERATDWMETRGYHDFETILICPRAYHAGNPASAACFDKFIAHEDIAAFIPEFA